MSKGMSLIELLVAISILVILTTVGAPSFIRYNHEQLIDQNAQRIKSSILSARNLAESPKNDKYSMSGSSTNINNYLFYGYNSGGISTISVIEGNWDYQYNELPVWGGSLQTEFFSDQFKKNQSWQLPEELVLISADGSNVAGIAFDIDNQGKISEITPEVVEGNIYQLKLAFSNLAISKESRLEEYCCNINVNISTGQVTIEKQTAQQCKSS